MAITQETISKGRKSPALSHHKTATQTQKEIRQRFKPLQELSREDELDNLEVII